VRIGTGKANLKFADGVGLFGFGPGGGRGVNVPLGSDDHDILEARALYLEHGDQKLMVVSFDVASGSRVVHRALLEALTEAGINLSAGQLWVVGTHTHSAPGHSWSNLYDLFGQGPFGYRNVVVTELVRKGLAAAKATHADLRECHLGVAQEVLWGPARNRSLRPFLANFGGDPTRWPVDVGIAPPPTLDLTPEQRCVDPRLTVIAFVAPEGEHLATWATWCCHPATFPRSSQRAFHRDWPGVAVDRLERETGAFAMIHQGANGDVTPLPSGERRVTHAIERVRDLGDQIGSAWLRGLSAAASRAAATTFELGFRTFTPREEPLPTFEIGASVIAGSEESDPGGLTRMIGEARRWPWRGGPQQPKLLALGPLQPLARLHPALRPSPEHPMWLLRLGSHLFFASPFEQSTCAARTTELALRKRWSTIRQEDITASPVGLVGDYAGYLTTPEEFALQNYEGGHTLYGRDQLAIMGRIWADLITSEPLDANGPAFQSEEKTLHARVADALALLASDP